MEQPQGNNRCLALELQCPRPLWGIQAVDAERGQCRNSLGQWLSPQPLEPESYIQVNQVYDLEKALYSASFSQFVN